MRARTRHTVFFALALALGGGLFAYLVMRAGLASTAASVRDFGAAPFLGFVALSFFNFLMYSWRWQIIVNDMLPRERRIPLWRMFLHRMSGYAAGYLTPASQVASEPVRVAMLRSEGVPLKEATSSVVLDLAFEIAAFVVFVISGVVLAAASGMSGGKALLGAEVFAGILVVVLVLFFWTIASGRGFFSGFLRVVGVHKTKRFAAAYTWMRDMERLMTTFFAGKPWTIAGIVALSCFVVSFRAVEAAFMAFFFGETLTLRDAFLLAALPGVVLLLPVPGGLGLYEGTNAATFAMLGLSLNAVAYTGIIRLRDFIIIGIGVVHAITRGESIVRPRT